jgi:hypothetical protein
MLVIRNYIFNKRNALKEVKHKPFPWSDVALAGILMRWAFINRLFVS